MPTATSIDRKSGEKFTSGSFVGVAKTDAFASAAVQETTVVYQLPAFNFPAGLAPAVQTFAGLEPGKIINTAVDQPCDVLVLLYTEYEISALLDVFTKNSAWSTARQKTWYWYGHNYNTFKPIIEDGDDAVKSGILGYLYPMKVGNTRVVFYKSELHPKGNGPQVPFIPVIKQLVGELSPKLVISTGTAGGVGSHIQCGDVAITRAARFHLENDYTGALAQLNTLSKNETQLQSTFAVNPEYVNYAAANFTKLAVPGLQKCYNEIGHRSGYNFLKSPGAEASIYITSISPAPAPQPMDIVSADYLTVDDSTNNEGLQNEGIMNDTDDAFAFYAIGELPANQRPQWLSVRNASEPQIVYPNLSQQPDPARALSSMAGAIYGVYQYCTTLNSAFACWGVIAGMNA
jgi:Phosphorylase superfamily